MGGADRAPRAEPAPASEKNSLVSFLRETPFLILVALVLAVLIKTFLVQAFFIPSGSMEPTLMTGDRVLVNRVVYHIRDIHRGDVIVFEDPQGAEEPDRNAFQAFFHWLAEGTGFTRPADEDFIKRVIGLPGDTVEAHGGEVYVNGEAMDEPYLTQRTRRFDPVQVPAGSLFVMGDNRGHSADSRSTLGFVPIDRVVGKAFAIIWPPSHAGWVR